VAPKAKGKSLWVTSMYGYKARAPLVAITMPGGESVQMDIPAARQHALQVLECCEAAVQDGYIIEFMGGKIPGLDERGAAVIVAELRKWREGKGL
jgi:hypothetical protein